MPNNETLEFKKGLVDEITKKFEDSCSTIVVDYRGLSVGEVTELRRSLREAGVEFKVYKNSSMRRAAQAAGFEGMDDVFKGPNAIAFSNEDVVAPAKILYEFQQEHEALEIKSGVIEGEVSSLETIEELAKLPNKEGMLSMLLSCLQSPVRDFAYVVKAVSERDGEVAEEATEENTEE